MIKERDPFDPYDETIVKEDYVITCGNTHSPTFEGCKINGKDIRKPVLGVFKVHEEYPLRISHRQNSSQVFVEPVLPEDDKRMPAEIVRDRVAHDFAFFVLCPADIDVEYEKWRKIAVMDDAFVKADGEKGPASLVYLEHCWFPTRDMRVAHPIMPTQIPLYFFHNFLCKGSMIYTYENLEGNLEGRINVSFERARDVTRDVSNLLGERFDDTGLLLRRSY